MNLVNAPAIARAGVPQHRFRHELLEQAINATLMTSMTTTLMTSMTTTLMTSMTTTLASLWCSLQVATGGSRTPARVVRRIAPGVPGKGAGTNRKECSLDPSGIRRSGEAPAKRSTSLNNLEAGAHRSSPTPNEIGVTSGVPWRFSC